MNIENLKNLLNSIKENKIPCHIMWGDVSSASIRVFYDTVSKNSNGILTSSVSGEQYDSGIACIREIIDVKQDYFIVKSFLYPASQNMQFDKPWHNYLEIIPISEIKHITINDSFLKNNFEVL